MYVWQHDDYCLHSQVDLCLFRINICTLMTLYGSKVCEPRCGFPYTVQLLEIRYTYIVWDSLSSMCVPVGTSDHHPLPGRNKVFHLGLNVMIIIWQTIGMDMHVYIWYIYLLTHIWHEVVCMKLCLKLVCIKRLCVYIGVCPRMSNSIMSNKNVGVSQNV